MKVKDIKPIVTKESLEKRIDKNRDEIHKMLNRNLPLDLVYMRTRMLSAQNEKLIAQLKEI